MNDERAPAALPRGRMIAFGAVAVAVIVAAILFLVVLRSPELSAQEASRVASIELAMSSTVLDGSSYEQTLRGVDQLIALCRAKADAAYGDRTVKQVTEDAANTLRGYQPELAAQLDRVLDNECD